MLRVKLKKMPDFVPVLKLNSRDSRLRMQSANVKSKLPLKKLLVDRRLKKIVFSLNVPPKLID